MNKLPLSVAVRYITGWEYVRVRQLPPVYECGCIRVLATCEVFGHVDWLRRRKVLVVCDEHRHLGPR